MRLSILSTLAAFSGLAVAQLSAIQVVADTENFIAKTEALIPTAQQLSSANTALYPIGTGPWFEVITGLNDIDTTIDATTNAMDADSADVTYTGDDARAITDAFITLINAQIVLIGNIGRAAGDLTDFSVVGEPMRDALDEDGSAVLDFAEALIESLQASSAELVRANLPRFEQELGSAIVAYTAPL